MKKGLIGLTVLLLIAILFFTLNKQEGSEDLSSTVKKLTTPSASESEQQYDDYSGNHMKGYGDAATPPDKDILMVDQLVSSYLMVMKDSNTLPLGENRETTAALLGENKYRTRLLAPDSPWINTNGELTDRWGTPLFFHGVSGDLVGVRSAGEDKMMWTGDDITINDNANEYTE